MYTSNCMLDKIQVFQKLLRSDIMFQILKLEVEHYTRSPKSFNSHFERLFSTSSMNSLIKLTRSMRVSLIVQVSQNNPREDNLQK